MDWSNVTAEDLIEALREVYWSLPPGPLSEFFSPFTLLRSYVKPPKLLDQLFHFDYFHSGMEFLRKPLAIVAALMTALSIAFLNYRPVIWGRPSAQRTIHIRGRSRWVFVLVFSVVSFILWFVSCGIYTVSWALLIGLLGITFHEHCRNMS